jgi:thiol-disulfide isomerase/thioredoxin
MKNPIMLAVVFIVVAVLGVGAFTLSQNSSQSDAMMKKNEAMMPKDDAAMEPKDAMMQKDGSMMEKTNDKMMGDKMSSSRYVEYSKAALDEASPTRRVLFFYASWCPTCKSADANFTANESNIPEDVTLIRVNYNDPETDEEEKDLAKKYGVTYQHTYVQIDSAGTETTIWNGGQIDELLTNIK